MDKTVEKAPDPHRSLDAEPKIRRIASEEAAVRARRRRSEHVNER